MYSNSKLTGSVSITPEYFQSKALFLSWIFRKLHAYDRRHPKTIRFGAQSLIAALIAAGAVIVDLRSKAEYAGGHIRGSVHIPLDQLSSNLKKFKDKEQVIITCCASGMRSASGKAILQGAGFKYVYNGGGWSSLNKYVSK